jgi:glycosyltransferase involved in cell wall biosynthesis
MPELDIKVIPNGIDTAKFHPTQKQALEKPLRLLTVCRLISRKRIDLLIRAAACARELGLDVRLDIAGEGNLMKQLQTLAKELNISENVVFMGRVPAEQMPQVYRQHDVFIMSSAHEGMSNAMLEAMASGLPIVTTKCEGVDELVADNGIVVEENTGQAIALGIRKLVDEPEIHKRMSAAARAKAEKFGWKSVSQQYLDLYRGILNPPP